MSIPTIKLHTGQNMPQLGLGTWNSDLGLVGAAVKSAILDHGYRHIDCASIYGNEAEIGAAFDEVFSSGKVKREEVFVTSKLWNTDHGDVEAACRKTLKDLQLEYLDLYLVHWAIPSPAGENKENLDEDGRIVRSNVPLYETWRAMEELVEKGLVKNIGISNFSTMLIIDLLTYAKVKPAMNQIELHPYLAQTELVDFCHKEGMAVTAYSPLGSPGALRDGDPTLLEDEKLQAIASDHDKTPAQVLLRWAMQRGTVAIPKTTNLERLAENINIFDFELSESEMTQLTALDRGHRFVNPIAWWGIPYFN